VVHRQGDRLREHRRRSAAKHVVEGRARLRSEALARRYSGEP